jgi:GT2 family glycosyltransferase
MPAYNAAATLRDCLVPLVAMQQRGEIAEIVVVDDGSTDATPDIAAEMGARVLASGGRLGPGGARNVAAREVRGDVLWFVDADVVVHDDAARVLSESLAMPAVVAVFGSYDDRPPAPNFLSQYKNLVHHHYHQRAAGAAKTFWAGCGAIRKADFLAAGGFDLDRYPRPSIEDIELGMRLCDLGGTIVLEPRLLGTHLKVWRLANLLRTEILSRALPWSRLIHERGSKAGALNVTGAERLRAVLAWCLPGSVVAALAGWLPGWAPLACVFAAGAANVDLLRLFVRRGGLPLALGGIAFHQLYYLYSSIVFVYCWVERRVAVLRGAGGGARRG